MFERSTVSAFTFNNKKQQQINEQSLKGSAELPAKKK